MFDRLKEAFHKINWILMGGWFSLFYWILESVRDVLLDGQESLVSRLFFPEPMTFWMRILVVLILILFGALTQDYINRHAHIRMKRRFQMRRSRFTHIPIIIAGLIFGLAYWIIAATRMALIHQSPFVRELFYPHTQEWFTRLLGVLLLVLFSIDAQSRMNKQRRDENSLRESEERLNQIIRQLPYPVQVSDVNGVTRKVNDAFLALFGILSKDQVIGRFNLKTDPLIDKLGMRDAVRRVYEGDTIFIPEVVFPNQMATKKELHTYEATLFPVFKQDGSLWHVVTIWKDMTGYKRAEVEKEEIQAQLHQAQKMEAIGVLAGGIAHDFNNLLTAIIGSADMALMGSDDAEMLESDLNEIKSAAEKASNLTRQLLLFSRKHPMGQKAVNLNQVITNLLSLLQRLIGEDIEIQADLDSELGDIQGDAGTLEQVIMNLTVNARDAMPRGGKIVIASQNVTLGRADLLNMPDLSPGPHVRLSVRDTGIGMDREVLRHIFEPFFTTKKAGSGTGLGLSVVYGIIKQHKGWISVDSETRKGTTFTLWFPMDKARKSSGESRRKTSKKRGSLTGNSEKLLVVEDDQNVRDYTTRALKRNGYQVFSAQNAFEAKLLFDKEEGNFDLMLCDVVLPGQTGIKLASDFIHRKPGLKVLMSSGYLDQKSQWPLIKEKGFRFIRKPYVLNDLLTTIKDAMTEAQLTH